MGVEGLMVKLARVVVGSIVTVLLAATPAAANPGGQPLQIKSASLSQDGQELVWRLVMQQPFSPGALAHDGRSLCLLLERAQNGSVAGQVCAISGVGPQARPRLAYQRVTVAGAGRARIIPATVSRTSSEDLTASFLASDAGLRYVPLRWQVQNTLAPPGCTPPTPNRIGCFSVFPAKPALTRLHTPQLVGCIASGPEFVSNGPPNVHDVALTFDDGPWGAPPSSDFVGLLAREHVPATFFEIGDQIGTYDPRGTVERQMLADGDMIGDHTWSHPDMTTLSASGQRAQLSAAAAAIKRATGFEPCLFRAPYGAVNSTLLSTARELGFSTIQWDVDPRDWSLPGTGAIYANVVANARDGSIVIQHFGGGPRYETLAALPQEIATLRARGYQFVTVAQMLGYQLIYR